VRRGRAEGEAAGEQNAERADGEQGRAEGGVGAFVAQEAPLDQLPKPVMSPLRRAGLLLLRAYLIASVLLITLKIFSSFIH
jgi:hypothetical protein